MFCSVYERAVEKQLNYWVAFHISPNKQTLLSRPSHWAGFIHHLRLLGANSSVIRSSKHVTPEVLLQLTSDTRIVLSRECKTISQLDFHAVLTSGSLASSPCQSHGVTNSSLWLPIDLFLEDAMDGSLVAPTSAVEPLIGAIQIFYCNIWIR